MFPGPLLLHFSRSAKTRPEGAASRVGGPAFLCMPLRARTCDNSGICRRLFVPVECSPFLTFVDLRGR
jgi:hypothetical protein